MGAWALVSQRSSQSEVGAGLVKSVMHSSAMPRCWACWARVCTAGGMRPRTHRMSMSPRAKGVKASSSVVPAAGWACAGLSRAVCSNWHRCWASRWLAPRPTATTRGARCRAAARVFMVLAGICAKVARSLSCWACHSAWLLGALALAWAAGGRGRVPAASASSRAWRRASS